MSVNANEPQIVKSQNPATHVLLALLLQTGGLIVAVTIAGIDDTVANLILLIMISLLILFMIMNASQFSGIVNILTNAETGAAKA